MYLKNDNGQITYPYTLAQLRKDTPGVSLPDKPRKESLESRGVFEVVATPRPDGDVVSETTPVFEDGAWKQAWDVRSHTVEEKTILIQRQVQARLDDFAKTRHYNSILSACSYAGSTVQKFADEAAYCVFLRDQTWAKADEILGDVRAGSRAMPAGIEDIEAELPAMAWPT
ncbi:hypothetical protein HBA55_29725 [Pseudomaricurvus alkylphenolicus]|uniref:hypothetical protein n=1 Tax=Pseudomaricurvus alkylphenolicus TaxID=1306991 RepID=UPI001423EC70|nr:hypothetical protein [Pseudomaricurvus alkylphenolicus]NIB43819.1 hypothetical protein [Pseudomaricurvus alkylphenolicus]